jgi:hypothetical protein
MIISVTIRIKDKERRLRALVDSGAEANCIRRGIAVKLNLAAKEGRVTPLSTPNGVPIRSYQNHAVSIAAVDALGERRVHDVIVVSCDFDLDNVDIILGWPWLREVDPDISFARVI